MELFEKDKIIAKVKKLLTLGMKNPDCPEAISAMAKAKEMLKKYDLETIDMNEDGTMDDGNILNINIEFGRENKDWESFLMLIVTKAFQCRYVRMGCFKGGIPKHSIIGSKTDVDFASFLFKYVRIQIMKMSDGYNYSVKDKRTYCFGCVMTVETAIESAFKKEAPTSEKEENKYALIVVKSDAVDKKTADIFPKLKPGTKMRSLNGSRDSLENGKNDGNKIRLNRQVGNTSNSMVR